MSDRSSLMDVALKLKHEALDDPEFKWQREEIIARVEAAEWFEKIDSDPRVPMIFR